MRRHSALHGHRRFYVPCDECEPCVSSSLSCGALCTCHTARRTNTSLHWLAPLVCFAPISPHDSRAETVPVAVAARGSGKRLGRTPLCLVMKRSQLQRQQQVQLSSCAWACTLHALRQARLGRNMQAPALWHTLAAHGTHAHWQRGRFATPGGLGGIGAGVARWSWSGRCSLGLIGAGVARWGWSGRGSLGLLRALLSLGLAGFRLVRVRR